MQPTNIIVQNKFQAGWALHQQGRLEDAAQAYSDVLRIYPRHFPALHMLGVIAQETGQSERAAELISKAITINPNIVEAYVNLGNALQNLGRLEEALTHFDRALQMRPDFAEIHLNRGNVLSDLFRFSEANTAYEAALGINPHLAAAHCYRAMALHALGRFDEALCGFDRAIALEPDYGEAWFNKAETQLLRGDLQNGWANYEWRKKKASQPAGNRSYPQPLLSTVSGLQGKTVLVHWEQGLGDTVQCVRYLRLLEDAGARVLFAPQPQLRTLMKGLGGSIRIVEVDDPSLEFDFHISSMSLPGVFGSTLASIPAAVPYLWAPTDRIAHWREKIGEQGLRVGICWQGNPAFKPDAVRRSFPLRLFEKISRLEGVRLISIHKGAGESQLQSLPAGMRVETLGGDFDAGPDAFVDTAAAMQAMDLIISCDTSVAHLAGALGRPVWLALSASPEWRWLLERSDSPWYPTMRIFRQKQLGDWPSVFSEIESALQDRLHDCA
jgi:Tfp pilus assembly protein PilF